MLITILAFFLTLGVLIIVHEYGHYRVAVACGVRVLRFSVGFGRVLWRRQASPDATEFVVCALPFGGYVRMLDEREGEVGPAELDRAFNRKPLWQRAAVVAAGPAANLLLAIILYSAAHWIGVDEPKAVLGPPTAATWPSAPACAPATGCARGRPTASTGTTCARSPTCAGRSRSRCCTARTSISC